jgi:RNA polymerase sigma-70 factor (ECF subfamily)
MREPEDEAAFDAFFSESWARLQSHAYVLTGSRESAQDLTQEALLRAWKRWDKVVVYENPEAWTRKVLHNLCIDSWRKHRQRSRHPQVELDSPPDREIPNDHYELAQAMRSLPGGQARALLLHDGLGMTVKETAAEIGVPEGTVKSWLSRARALVAHRLDPARTISEVRSD